MCLFSHQILDVDSRVNKSYTPCTWMCVQLTTCDCWQTSMCCTPFRSLLSRRAQAAHLEPHHRPISRATDGSSREISAQHLTSAARLHRQGGTYIGWPEHP